MILIIEAPEGEAFIVVGDLGDPFVSLFAKVDAFKTSPLSSLGADIHTTLNDFKVLLLQV